MENQFRGALLAIALVAGAQGATFAATPELAAPEVMPPAVSPAALIIEVEDVEAGQPNFINTPRDGDDDHVNHSRARRHR
jgi:hypothetical protein